MDWSVWIGFDPRETDAFAVARQSMRHHMVRPVPINGLILSDVRQRGLYWRPTSEKNGQLWDNISDAPMSTEFACSRFLTPILAKKGWALFTDADVMARDNVEKLFELADPDYAVMVVKHNHNPKNQIKMDGQAQTRYARKNWSSVMLFNCNHEAHERLTIELINSVPGRDLHRFCWLHDEMIGELPVTWNYLVGHTKNVTDPKLVHFTDGVPSMSGYEDCEYAGEWRSELVRWATR